MYVFIYVKQCKYVLHCYICMYTLLYICIHTYIVMYVCIQCKIHHYLQVKLYSGFNCF